MKKILILSIMLSAIIFGLFLITTESKAQKEDKAGNQMTAGGSSGGGMTFAYFSGGCFYEGDEIIGRDIKFKISGVSVNLRLIKLNQKTREFNTGVIKGKLLLNKIEVTIAQDIINNGNVKYTADKVEKTGDKIFLKGNSKFSLFQDESIEADEIIITTN